MHFRHWNGTNLLTEATPICLQTANLSVLSTWQSLADTIPNHASNDLSLKCHVSLQQIPMDPLWGPMQSHSRVGLSLPRLSSTVWMNPLMTNLLCLPCLHIQPGVVYLRPLLLLLSLRFCSPKQHFTVLLAFPNFPKFLHNGTLFRSTQIQSVNSWIRSKSLPRELPGREDLSTICVWVLRPSLESTRRIRWRVVSQVLPQLVELKTIWLGSSSWVSDPPCSKHLFTIMSSIGQRIVSGWGTLPASSSIAFQLRLQSEDRHISSAQAKIGRSIGANVASEMRSLQKHHTTHLDTLVCLSLGQWVGTHQMASLKDCKVW